jgi:hypothetical protein
MFWNKKEDKELLPDLPTPNKTISPFSPREEPHHEDGDNMLPSFPDSPMQKGFSQSAIKEAISNEEVKEEKVGSPLNSAKAFKAVELEDDSATIPPMQIKSFPSVNIPPVTSQKKVVVEEPPIGLPPEPIAPMQITRPSASSSRPKNEIYVKIDKFVSAKKSLSDIDGKIDEITDLLKKIRDTKMREEQELASWEKDLSSLKLHVQDVTQEIFDRVE